MNFAEIRKTIAAALVAGGGALVTAATTDGITANEGWVILGTTLAAAGAVWYVPNAESQ